MAEARHRRYVAKLRLTEASGRVIAQTLSATLQLDHK